MKYFKPAVSIFVSLLCLIAALPLSYAECVNIGAVFSLTGENAPAQVQTIQGIRIASSEIMAKTGTGHCINLLWFDDLNTPIGSHIAAKNAARKKVSAIAGPALSSNALMVAKVAQENKIPMIATTATNPEITRTGDYIFRAAFTDPFQGKIIAEYAAKTLKAKTAVIFRKVSSDYSISLAKVFQETFEASGCRVILVSDYLRNRKDFKEMLKPLKSLSPDILFIPGHSESGIIVRQALETGISSIPVGGDGWATQSFFEKGGNSISRGYYLTEWSSELSNLKSRKFVAAYGEQYNINPGMVLSYDAMHILWDAIQRAGSSEPQKIRNALARTKDFQGVTGNITFDQTGDPVKPAVIMEIINGTPHMVQNITP